MFSQFSSIKYPEWYLGFTKNGDPKSAKKSLRDQKATRFIRQNWTPKVQDKQKHTKRHIGKRTRKKHALAVLLKRNRYQERRRKLLCLLSSLCLAKKRRQGATARCKRISRQNRCTWNRVYCESLQNSNQLSWPCIWNDLSSSKRGVADSYQIKLTVPTLNKHRGIITLTCQKDSRKIDWNNQIQL